MIRYCLYVREDLAAMGDAFFEAKELYGMRSDTYMYRALRDYLFNKGIRLHTQYLHPPEESEVIICLNETGFFQHYQRSPQNKKIILILTEPPVYNAQDWLEEKHRAFDVVVSYAEELLERSTKNYRISPFPIEFNSQPAKLPTEAEFNARKLSCMVAGAFTITESDKKLRSLLFERYRILKWFNQQAKSDLDFYSRSDPRTKFLHFRGASLLEKLNKNLRKKIAEWRYERTLKEVYRGAVPGTEKNKTLSAYRFNFCLENTYGIKGLISEKIFDCFEAGTVPVYYGAPDIGKHIPESCYIRYEKFSSLNELHHFLAEMNYSTYIQYLTSAQEFLKHGADYFSVDRFTKLVYEVTST